MSKNSIFDDQFFSTLGGKSKPEQSTKKGGRPVADDLVASFGEGAGGLVEGIGTFAGGSDSALARIGKEAVDYWGERKSDKLKAQQQELGTLMEDENAGMLDVAGHVITSPRLMASLLAGSAPSMALGMGAGAIVARGMTAGKIMTTAAGGLTRTGSALAAGIGEGAVLMPEVYAATNGDLATGTAGAMALGVVTNLATPGNIGAQFARRVSGEGAERATVGMLNRTIAGRVAGSGLAEAGQEFVQEGGQAVLEQVGRSEDINLLAAAKQGTVGAIMGGTMGVGLHPLVGDGAPVDSVKPVEEPAPVPAPTDIEKALEADPNNPVLLAEQVVADARRLVATDPSPTNEMQLRVAEARLVEARNPNSRDAADTADHVAAQAVRDTVGDEGVRAAIDVAVDAADSALRSAPDVDGAVAAFAAREQASSVGATAAAMAKVEEGVAEAAAMNIETYNADLAEADLRATEEADRQERLRQEVAQAAARPEEITVDEPAGQTFPEIEASTREEVFAAFQPRIVEQEVRVLDVNLPQQEREEAKRKMYALQAERDAIAAGLPAEAGPGIEQITYVGPGEPALEDQLERIESSPGYTVRRNEAETASRGAPAYDVVGPNGIVFDTYAGQAAEQDAAATAERLNARDNTAATLPQEVIAHRDELVAAGFLGSMAQSIEQEDTDTLRARANPETGVRPFERDQGSGGVGAATVRLAAINNTILQHLEADPNGRLPAWISRVAQAEGRKLDGWFFSEAPTDADVESAPLDRASATERISGLVGEKAAKVLLDGGVISFVDTATELVGDSFSIAGKIQGATDASGRITLVLENLTNDNFDAVLSHEALHSTLENLVGKETYAKLMAKLGTLLKVGNGSNWAKDAERRVPKSTPAEHRLEEVAAYAVELASDNDADTTNPLVRWGREFMSALRAAMIKSSIVPEALKVWAIENLQANDLRHLAIAGLRAKASGAGTGTRQSMGRNYQEEIESLLAEHMMPETTGPRRAEINAEIAKLRTAQRVEQDAAFESSRTSEATYGTPVEGAVSVRAVHYSGAQRSTLSSAAYGTGLKGEEAGRLSGSENNDIRPRIHFYVDEGNGITPEAGVGGFAHAVTLNNLYNLKADPLKLRQADSNAMERAIVAAGFDGYYAPDYRGAGQGAAVLIGEHNVPVKPYVDGGSVNPAPSKSPQQIYAENLRNSKLPAGNMTGREWLVAIKGSEFATLNVLSALESRQDERFYRDDLPRLNELRFSIAEEVKIGTEPVAPPSPVELNIMQNVLRKPFERALEKFRTVIQDKNVTLRRVQKIAGIAAENIRMDTIGALDRLGSRLMVQQQELVLEPLARIENILSRSGFSEDAGRAALDQALIDFHVEEYNDHIATINPARYKMENGKRVYVSGFDTEHPGSGIKTADAKARIINLLKAAERGDKQALAVLEARGVYRDMISNLQAFAVERGLEKQETIDSWNEKFPNYTPFNRDLDLDEDLSIGTVPGSQGFSLRTGIARRAMGSAAEIVSPLVSTTLFGLKTTTRGENAVVSRTMLNFARAFVPNYFTNGEWKPMWRVDTVPTQRVLKKVNVYRTKMANGEMSPEFYNRDQARDYADYQQALWVEANPDADPNTSGIGVQRIGNEPQNRVIVQKIPNPLGDEFTMVIPEDGENRVIVFDKHSHDAVAIMNALKGKATSGPNAATLNKFLTIPRMFSRWVMATSTGFNPVFSIFNAARDIQGAMISIGSDQIPGWTKADSLAVGRNFFPAANSIWRHRGAVFRALHSNGLKPRPEPGSYAEWADEAARYGGVTGVRQSIADIDDAETQIRRLFGQREITRTNSSREASDWLSSLNGAVIKLGDSFARFGDGETKVMGLGWISRNVVSATARLNEAAELATRTAVFKAATEKFMAAGKTEVEAKTLAANISKNVSTNFNRRGEMSGMINQLYPFFSAATQGSARVAEVMFQKETYKVEFGGRVVLDQRTKLSPYGKVVLSALTGLGGLQAALLAMAGFDDEEPPSYIKDRAFVIPLGTGGHYIAIPMPHGFNTIVNFGRDMADAIIHRENAAQHIASAIWQAPAFNPFGSAGNVATDFTPAIVDGPLSLYMNMDPFGRPIAKQDPDPANPTPGFTRAHEGASGFARAVAEGLNLISGGNEDQKGFVSPTPDQIDFALGIVGGGVGRELGKATSLATNTATRMAGGEVESIPTHKLPLIGRLYGNVNDPTAMRSKLFNMRQELNEKYARYKGLGERGDVEAAEAFWDENPELALRADIERFVRQDAKQRKQRALARGEGEIGEVNRITEEQNALAAELVTEYRNLTSRD